MLTTTAMTYERSALVRMIQDLETTLNALEKREDAYSVSIRRVLEGKLKQRKRELMTHRA